MNGREAVWEATEAFRSKYLVGSLTHLPVDIFTVAELELRLHVLPFDDLFEKHEVDAALTHDFTSLLVDAESYIVWEKGPLWKQRRLRFSVAHELGHFVLHREIAKKVQFTCFADFATWTKNYHGQKFSLEQEANEFAGRLLVPAETLRREFDRFGKQIESFVPHWEGSSELRHRFAESVVKLFEVNAQVIEVRLDREGIWPAS